MPSLAMRAGAFRALHAAEGAFISRRRRAAALARGNGTAPRPTAMAPEPASSRYG